MKTTIKVNKFQLAILYTLVLDKIATITNKTPIKYVEDIESLELMLSVKVKNY
jgi:hypothetical protein